MSTMPTARDQVQNPLTLVMRIKSPEAHAALKATVEQLQSLPREVNPIAAALDTMGNVHFARFVFLDDTRFALITTYDGDFSAYINEFIDHIGPLFDKLLQYMDGAPPLPVQQHRYEFLEYVRRFDLKCVPPFYSAYPSLTVLEVVANRSV
jgi:hypothetical protein